MNIIYDEELILNEELFRYLTEAAEISIRNEGLDPDLCEISLSLVSAEEIRSLNSQFRGVDRETDVLSFPQFDDFEELGDNEVAALGDIVICEDVAQRQAEEFGHSYEREFVYLFVHSIHHLLGYDHMEDDEKAEMRAAEEAVMNELGITRDFDGDIQRAETGKVTMDAAALLAEARAVSARAYAPYSRFFVGAALMTGSGTIYTGVNIENASYGATICAERSAVSAAVTAGESAFRAIAVYSPSGPAQPCGICRQVLAEFGQDMDVITGTCEDDMEITKLSELLPKGFTL